MGGMPVAPLWDQDSYEPYNDGTQSGAISKGTANNSWTQDSDEIYQVRILVQETNGTNESPTLTVKAQYQIGSAGWNDITSSTPVQFANSSSITDGEDTTQRLGSGTFVTGGCMESNPEATNGTFAGNDETEFVVVLYNDSAQLSNGQTLYVRLVESDGTAFNSETNTPQMTVNQAVTDVLIENQIDAISKGMKANTAAQMGGVLVE